MARASSPTGVLVISAIQGTLGTLIFWFLGLASPLLWGVVMFFMSMIPMAGSFVVWVPAAVYLALTDEYTEGRHPGGMGRRRDRFNRQLPLAQARGPAHPDARTPDFFAVLGGLQVFGVLGLVLGPGRGVTLALIDIVREAARPPSTVPTSRP